MLYDGVWPLLPALPVAWLAWRRGAVTGGGAAVGGCLAFAAGAGAGWGGVCMLLALLVLGTLLSRSATAPRDALQVLCNGGAGGAACAALWAGWAPGALAATGAWGGALSDTISGEWGRRRCARPRILLLGRPVEAGRDGGMSPEGTLAGALAALPVAAVALATGLLEPREALIAAVAAFGGNLLDSALGVLQGGWGRRGNDWTNLLATAGAGGAAVLLA